MRPATTPAGLEPIPDWVGRADRALAQAVKQTRVIAAATPRNHERELTRLASRVVAGELAEPRFEYAAPRPTLEALRVALERLAEGLDGEGALGGLYAARARELEAEAEICQGVGREGIVEIARRRFASSQDELGEALSLAKSWLSVSAPSSADGDPSGERVMSDDASDPRSLVCALRAEVGKRGLPFRVVTSSQLSALAATGDGVLIVASGRPLTKQDVARTVLHEVAGHAAPAARAIGSRLGLFTLGTARGSDDQEGRALCLEAERGHLTSRRRRELALRHVAALSVWDGASFADTMHILLEAEANVSDAVRIAARVHRGGGLAREIVYLPAFLRVDRARRKRPDVDRVLAAGKVSVEAAPALRRWLRDESQPPSLSAPDPTA